MANYFSKETGDRINELSVLAEQSTVIDNSYYSQYDVKRGLRDVSGKGVLCGLTEISEIISFTKGEGGERIPTEGELYFRGINVKDLISGFAKEQRFGFEETAYLLLFGKLPTAKELTDFQGILSELRSLPPNFVRDVTLKKPPSNMMIGLSRSILALYSYDDTPDDISIPNVLRQILQLLAQFPLVGVYEYRAYQHYNAGESLIIHSPLPGLSTAENILHTLRADSRFTRLEAETLDLCMVLHAEHGGGNNSSFTTHVVSSSGTDTYSVVAASLGSLKGPRHGGANIKVVQMFDDLKKNVKKPTDGNIADYLKKLLAKEGFDRSGLIYGMGHAVYSLSDPRADILRGCVKSLAAEKGVMEDYEIYSRVERLAPEIISEVRHIYKGVSANVDFYSGLVYNILGLPQELFTPIFAFSRMAGWGAHRIEELSNNGKIIRPGYESVAERKDYVPLADRK